MDLPAGCLKRIHVNQHRIRSNKKNGTLDPVVTVKSKFGNHYGSKVLIDGPSEVKYLPEKPLSCGARVWIETRSAVTIEE